MNPAQLREIRQRDHEKPPIETHYRRQAFFDQAIIDRRRLIMALDDSLVAQRLAEKKMLRLQEKVQDLHRFIRGGQGRPRGSTNTTPRKDLKTHGQHEEAAGGR